MKRLTVLFAALLLSGCASTAPQPEAATPTRTPAARETATPTPTPTLASRSQMDEATRTLAEAFYLHGLRDTYGIAVSDDTRLISAGDAACDSMDRGDSPRATLIVVAALLPDLGSTDQVATVAGVASGTLCPEHAP